MRARTLGGPNAAQLIGGGAMKVGRGSEHGMIGRRAVSSGGRQNQNSGDLRGYLPKIFKTFAGFQNVCGGRVIYRRTVHFPDFPGGRSRRSRLLCLRVDRRRLRLPPVAAAPSTFSEAVRKRARISGSVAGTRSSMRRRSDSAVAQPHADFRSLSAGIGTREIRTLFESRDADQPQHLGVLQTGGSWPLRSRLAPA